MQNTHHNCSGIYWSWLLCTSFCRRRIARSSACVPFQVWVQLSSLFAIFNKSLQWNLWLPTALYSLLSWITLQTFRNSGQWMGLAELRTNGCANIHVQSIWERHVSSPWQTSSSAPLETSANVSTRNKSFAMYSHRNDYLPSTNSRFGWFRFSSWRVGRWLLTFTVLCPFQVWVQLLSLFAIISSP